MSQLIIIRGPSAVGKTSVSTLLCERYKQKGLKVAHLRWDDVLYHVQPFDGISDTLVIHVTRCMIGIAELILRTRNVDLIVLDGVFVLEEERRLLMRFCKAFSVSSCVRLFASQKELLVRNKAREQVDFLEEERIDALFSHKGWEKDLDNEYCINSSNLSCAETVQEIEKRFDASKPDVFQKSKNCQQNLFSSSLWGIGDFLRFKTEELVFFEGIPFYSNGAALTMLRHFDFPSSEKFYSSIINAVSLNEYKIHFKYIDDNSEGLAQFKSYISRNEEKKIVLREKDAWFAPILVLNLKDSLEEHLLLNSKRLNRTIKKCHTISDGYQFYTNDIDDPLLLWQDFLKVDAQTWKFQEQSHMQGLQREDLKYFHPILADPDCNSLCVGYDMHQKPQAYSFMSRLIDKPYWYAIKWGCTDEGRKNFAGIATLLWHLRFLFKKSKEIFFSEGEFVIDFWGKEQPVYSQIKNKDVLRKHLVLEKGTETEKC